MCNLPACADAAVCSNLVDTPFKCPDGLNCGHGPVCTIERCGSPGCAQDPICGAAKGKRGPKSPEGLHLGPGPVCTPYTCGLPGCKDTPMCAVNTGKQTNEEHIHTPVVGSQFGCPRGSHCGHGPVCTSADCHLPGCADTEVCIKETTKRTAEKDVNHPCPMICDMEGRCGCAAEGRPQPVLPGPPAVEQTEEKAAGKPIILPCPMICDEQGHCGCNYNGTVHKVPGQLPTIECTPNTCHLPGCAGSEACVKHTNEEGRRDYN